MALTEFFNAIFAPLTAQGPLFAIVSVSLIIAFVFSLFYLVLVDQQKVRRIKSETKEMQEKMKKAQKDGNDKEIKALFSNSMKLQNEMMVLSIKPIIATLVFFVLIGAWLSANYGDINAKIIDGKGELQYGALKENVSVSGNAFIIAGETHAIGDKITLAGKAWIVSYIPDGRGFFERLRNAQVYGMLVLENVRYALPFYFPGVGDKVGWLGIYIIVSLPATMLFRKILGVD